jgi:hypothetical protein
MTFVKLPSGIGFWSDFSTVNTSTANTLSTFASNRATVSASFSSTLSGVASNFLVPINPTSYYQDHRCQFHQIASCPPILLAIVECLTTSKRYFIYEHLQSLSSGLLIP